MKMTIIGGLKHKQKILFKDNICKIKSFFLIDDRLNF